MIFLFMLIFLNQTEHKILLQKRPPSISFSTSKSKLFSTFLEGGKGDTLRIVDYVWVPRPHGIIYVTDTVASGYCIVSVDWNIGDTVFWEYYYPENDTQTGKPTGEYKKGIWGYITYAYEDVARCYSYWIWRGWDIWDPFPAEGVILHEEGGAWCGDVLDDLVGVTWDACGVGFSPATIWHGNLYFYEFSFFPGKWYVEIYERMAGGNKVFLKRDSCELRDTFIGLQIIYPNPGDTVYGRENIVLGLHENHWAKVKLTITGIPVKGKSSDTTIEFHIYRMAEEGGKAIPFDFGFQFGKKYKIVADATDYSGNRKVDSTFCVVGKPNIDVVLNPNEVFPDNIPDMPQYGNRTEVIVKVTTPSGRPISGYPVVLQARGVPGSGGHDHDENRPVGNFQQNNGQTNENGEFKTFYYASQFGGIERIIASGGEVRDSADLTVRVPGLILLPESEYYIKIGGTCRHHGPSISDTVPPACRIPDNNHLGTNDLIDALSAISLNYVQKGGEKIYINDVSLPYGGLFDMRGDWRPPHYEHRVGTNADVSGWGTGGRFMLPDTMRKVVRNVARSLGLYIDYNYENGRNHYHFTVGR